MIEIPKENRSSYLQDMREALRVSRGKVPLIEFVSSAFFETEDGPILFGGSETCAFCMWQKLQTRPHRPWGCTTCPARRILFRGKFDDCWGPLTAAKTAETIEEIRAAIDEGLDAVEVVLNKLEEEWANEVQ